MVENITIPKNLTKVRDYAFVGCSGIKTLNGADFAGDIGVMSFSYCTDMEKAVLPKCKNIADYAFEGCVSMESVAFGDSLLSIGVGAFSLCYSLPSVNIPKSVEYIDVGAFGRNYSQVGKITASRMSYAVTADVNTDGKLNALDSLILRKKIVGKI